MEGISKLCKFQRHVQQFRIPKHGFARLILKAGATDFRDNITNHQIEVR